MRRRLAFLVAWLALGGLPLHAAPSSPPEPPALRALAVKLATQVQRAGPEPPLRVDLTAPSAVAQSAFFTLLASELAGRDLPVIDPAADGGTAKARTTLRLRLDARDGIVRARGDLFGTWRNFWAGRTPLRPPEPSAVLDAQVPEDPEAVSLLGKRPGPALPGGASSGFALTPLAHLDSKIAALGAGDLDGDGLDEIAALTKDAVLVFDGRGHLLARHALDDLPRASRPSRDPFGAVVVRAHPARLAVFSGAFAHGEWLTFAEGALKALGPLTAPRVGTSSSSFAARITPGENTFVSTSHVRLPFNAYSEFSSGGQTWALALRPGAQGRIWTGKHSRPLKGIGSGGALADLNGDGAPELVTTAPARSPSPDEVEVRSAPAVLRSGREGSPVLAALPVPGAIVVATPAHIAPGPFEGVILGVRNPDGSSELVLLGRSASP